MRRSLIPLTILIAALLSGCTSGDDAVPAPITLPMTSTTTSTSTTTTVASFATLAEVRMEPYCSTLDGFCINFPVVDDELLLIPQRDPHYYSHILTYGYDKGTFAFCTSAGFSECDVDATADEFPMMNYVVEFQEDLFPGEAQSEWYTYCYNEPGAVREDTVIAGQPAVRVSCKSGSLGTFQGVYFRYKGREVRISASSQLRAPLYFDEIVTSFQLTT